MAAAVTIENFLTRQANLHRPIQQQRCFGHYDFMIEGIALTAEASAIGRGAYPNMCRRHFQDLRESTVEVMRRLRA